MHNETTPDPDRDDEKRDAPETDDDGGELPLPFAPDKDDDTPLGDTDQHSDA